MVRTRASVPPFITRLTGITQSEVDRQGVPVAQAFAAVSYTHLDVYKRQTRASALPTARTTNGSST